MNSLISLHSYLVLNGAIAIGYIIARLILSLPLLRQNILQSQRLKFARYSFFTAVLSFLLVPIILSAIPSSYHSNFQFEPIVKNASAHFLQHHKMINEQIIQIGSSPSFFSMNIFFMLGFISVICIFIGKYIKSLFILRKLQQNSFCLHKINNVHILFSATADIPFCWSLFKNHFIAIPHAFLEKKDDLKLAIRHELQHIRQGDTHWLHFLMLVKSFCFWNPFMKLWINWLDELQEFSCDESIITKKTSPAVYAQCLVNAASNALKHSLLPQGTLGIHGLSKSILYRRVNMLFNYNHDKTKKLAIMFVYLVSFLSFISIAYALNGSPGMAPLSTKQVAAIIKKSHLDKSFQVTATPEVVSEINNIRNSDKARLSIHQSLQRMKKYQPFIQEELQKKGMPNDLLVVPLVESGYRPLDQSENRVLAAGIWQIIPETGKHFGLTINEKQDDRLDTALSTQAALTYLNANHEQFNDWRLAIIAYEIGENNTDQLIQKTGSRDAWVLARSSAAPENLKKFVAMYDAALIIMHNPALINDRG
jgi:beta-lactamase regulating signal transducer with metallopeptidase domain